MTADIAEARVSPQEAEPPLILALDIGTSSLRALIYDRLGRVVEGVEAREKVTVRNTPPGASELDPDALLALIYRCIDSALAEAGALTAHIAAVAVDTFVNNVLGIDKEGRVVLPLTTYADTRAAGEVEDLRKALDEREVHNRTGCRFHPSYLPARLRWLAREFPAAFARVSRWVSIGEYLELDLFGDAAVSYSVAAWTGLLDWRRLCWDDAVLDVLPITLENLSPLRDANMPRRGLQPAFAQRWPALADVPWFPALGDGAAANIGSGCTNARRVALTVGTSSAMRVVLETDLPTLPSGLWCYRVDGRRALPGGALTEGGMVYSWLRQVLRLADEEAIEAALAEREPDAHGLTVLPFLAGERSPGWAGHARATLHGLTLATQPLDILQAGMEAVAYRIALVYEQIRSLLPDEPQIVASGGAILGSPVWLQMMTDVLGRPVRPSAVTEASARGVALLALEALGVYADVSDAPAFVGASNQPRPAYHRRYQAAIARQRELYDRLISLRD